MRITKNTVFSALSVAASATSNSEPKQGLNLSDIGVEGYFSAEIVITGTGTATIGYEVSSDGANWEKPSTTGAISTALTLATGLTAGGGPASNGRYFMQLTNIPTTEWLRFYITETGTSNAVVVTLTLIMQ